jgi:ribosome-binding factor A
LERRAQKYHRERLGEALREEIETIVEGELGDPRIGLVNVDGDDEEARLSLEGLTAAVGFIRHEVAERLHLRHPPELFFQLDRSEQQQARIDELLERTKRNRGK